MKRKNPREGASQGSGNCAPLLIPTAAIAVVVVMTPTPIAAMAMVMMMVMNANVDIGIDADIADMDTDARGGDCRPHKSQRHN